MGSYKGDVQMRACATCAIRFIRDYSCWFIAFVFVVVISYNAWKTEGAPWEIKDVDVLTPQVGINDMLEIVIDVNHRRQCRTEVGVSLYDTENHLLAYTFNPYWLDATPLGANEHIPVRLLVPPMAEGSYNVRIRLWSECPDATVHVIEAPYGRVYIGSRVETF
jgi:hypothetical protein